MINFLYNTFKYLSLTVYLLVVVACILSGINFLGELVLC